ELAWRQWTVLGVAGVAPPPAHAIDLEALVAFMPFVANADPRLGDEALDWYVRIGPRFVARSRLRTLVALMPGVAASVAPSFPTLELAQSKASLRTRLSQKSRAPRLDAPVLVQLRSRQIFGVGARADVIAALVSQRRIEPVRISSIGLVGYTKPAVATVLDDLASVGVLRKWSSGNAAHYLLEKPGPLRALLDPVPPAPPSWAHRLALVAVVLDTWRRFGERRTYAVELAKALERARPLTVGLVHEPPPVLARPRTLVADVSAWAMRLLEA
ncbi:MAG: hypothetical protein HYZ27_05275, partial [Deltaproteobacteria bacterium]|nr:hypothetical protein [Deltaproteobacteria bacterium]